MKTIKIKNFNLTKFSNLLMQSLIVNPQLMLEFNEDTIKSCSFSPTKSLIKLWTIEYGDLIISEENVNQLSIDDVEDLTPKGKLDIEIEKFNFYIFRGDSFLKYISIFNSEPVELTFNLKEQNNKLQAISLIVKGNSTLGTKLETSFPLTSEELITNIVGDYSEVLKICTPDENFIEFGLNKNNIKEIRDLIKKLKGAGLDNTAFLNFTVNVENNTLDINDNVFNTKFPLITKNKINKSFKFKILKSDLLLSGNIDYMIYTEENTPKVIFMGKYSDSIVVCMATKVGETTDVNVGSDEAIFDEDDDILSSLNLEEYGDI